MAATESDPSRFFRFVEDYAFRTQELSLQGACSGLRTQADLSLRVHDTLPRHRGAVRQCAQRVTHTSRLTGDADEFRDLPISCDTPSRNPAHDAMDHVVGDAHVFNKGRRKSATPGALECTVSGSPRLANRHKAVGIETARLLGIAVGPTDPDTINSCRVAQPKMHAHIVVREIAPAAKDF